MKHLILITILIASMFYITSCSTLLPKKTTEEPTAIEPDSEEPETEPENEFEKFELLNISKGEHTDKIVLSWEADPEVTEEIIYHIYRADKFDSPYKKIAEASGSTWEDINTTKGLKLYYRIVPVVKTAELSTEEDTELTTVISTPEKMDTDHSNFGYARSSYPKGTTFNALTRTYNKGRPKMSAAERKKANAEMEKLKERVMHSVKLRMMLAMVTPHMNSGRVVALTDFSQIVVDKKNRLIYLFDKDYTYAVVLYSSHVTRNISSRTNKALYTRLALNSVSFSVKSDEIEVTDDKGFTRILPSFKSLALATQYFPKTRNWKNETMIFPTRDKELQREIQKAQGSPTR